MNTLQHALRYDPRTFVAGFAMWCFVMGAGLSGPGTLFEVIPSFRVIASFGVPEWGWGLAMLAAGLALLRCLRPVGEASRVVTCFLVGALWVLFGLCVLWGGALEGYFSASGAYALLGGCGCWLAVQQWVWNA